MASADLFALILEPKSPRPYSEIGKIIAIELGQIPADTISRVRYGSGILVTRRREEVVEEIASLLKEIDVQTRVIPNEILEATPRGYRATQLEFHEGALCVRSIGSMDLVILDGDLKGIHVHAIPRDPSEIEESAGAFQMPIFSALKEGHISPRALKIINWIQESGKPPPLFILTLYGSDPVGAVRFERENTDYSMLGEDKLQHSIDNFILLTEKILSMYPDLIHREHVSSFLERLNPEDILYFKKEEMQNFDRWIQAWIRLENLDKTTNNR